MKPPRFRYHRAFDVADAVELLAVHGPDARCLAGGQSLVPMMNQRQVAPAHLVDLNRCGDLNGMRRQADTISIGAMTRQRTVEHAELARAGVPMLVEALGFVGHPATRNRGTVGGSLAHGDPAAEIATVLTCLDARVRVRGRERERTLSCVDLFRGPFLTVLDPTEVMLAADVPVQRPGEIWGFVELSRRVPSAALTSAAVVLRIEDGHTIAASVALGGAEARPTRSVAAETVLVGEPLSESVIRQAAQQASRACVPVDDWQASGDYRRQLVQVAVERALRAAIDRGRRPGHAEWRRQAEGGSADG